MSDIFQEVEEDLRRERLKKLWDRYGTYLIAAAVAIVLAVGGWRAWEWQQEKTAQAAGGRFEAAVRLIDDGKHAEAERALTALEREGPAGYALLARFAAAAEIAQRDKAAAVTHYDALASDTRLTPVLRDLAQVRAGLILVDSAPFADIVRRLEPLAAPTGAFRHTARELLALAAWKAGDAAATKRWLDAVTGDPATPTGVRTRMEILRALTASS